MAVLLGRESNYLKRKGGDREMKKLFIATLAMAIMLGVLAPVVLQGGTASACTLGLSPGYWKNHTEAWVGYSTGDYFDTVFGVGPHVTLLQALQTGGGGLNALNRQAVGAILNASSIPGALSEAYVLQFVRHVYNNPTANDWEYYKDLLESYVV